tara:strand:- start:4066 stop:4941 length:876 start_codon:yes stop_codon:yes gene_type:complete
MVTLNPQIIKIPAFMTKFIDVDNLTMFQKVKLIIKGKLTTTVFKNFSEKNITLFLNTFFKFDGKLIFNENRYIKISENKSKQLNYPNLRVTRILLNEKEFLNHLFESYLLNIPNFKPGDKVLDCGANVGELFLAFENLNLNIDYLGFEPDPNVFECLNLNTDKSNYNCALSNKSEEVDFYIDSSGGNSSIHESNETKLKTKVEARLLDEFIKNEKIKLFKLDAEGYELEVLLGGKNNLHNISYISVDCGAEKGMSQETTFVEVNNYLTSKNFEIIAINEKRLICLYKNKND